MSLVPLINILKMSGTQKSGVFVFFALLICVVILHNPMQGYNDTQYYENYIIRYPTIDELAQCDKLKKEDRDRSINDPTGAKALNDAFMATKEETDKHLNDIRLLRLCDEGETQLVTKVLPFSEWSSRNPVIHWFGSLPHLIEVVLALIILCATWIVLFRSKV